MPIKKYSKVKFTLRKELIIILAVIVVMLVATILLQLPSKNDKFVKAWNKAGSSITENTVYKETTMNGLEGIVSKAKSDEYVYVYFANKSDSTAVTNFDLIYRYANTFEVDTVYIIDSSFASEKDRELDEDFDKMLSDIEAKFKDSDSNTITLDQNPNFWVFKDGKLVSEIDQDLITEKGNWNAALIQMFALSK